jgi:tRNA (cytidine/uridine-2'-O-)-methyltransferase
MNTALFKNFERHVVLVSPEIHWNTGNIGRTCLGTDTHLHLIQPLGFSLESKAVKRAGLDYWPNVSLHIWNDFDHFASVSKPLHPEVFLFSRHGQRSFWSMHPSSRMFLIFGAETKGLPDTILDRYRQQIFSIPTNRKIRSLNLSTAVGIALYESIRQAGKE